MRFGESQRLLHVNRDNTRLSQRIYKQPTFSAYRYTYIFNSVAQLHQINMRVLRVIFLLLAFTCGCLCESLKIPLFRQRTPRENIMVTPNIPQHGVWLDWLKKEYRTNDTIPLMRFLDSQFYGYVNVGNPGQQMKVVFDTAWSTSWIISQDCPTKSIGCWFHSKYNHGRSSTYESNGTSYIANEGSYNLTGYFSRDSINFGHSTVNQTFVEMTGVPYWYAFTRADGIIGMALERGDINPFFYNVLQQTNITNPVFSIYLNRDKSSKSGGSITLGEIDVKHIHSKSKDVKDNITYVPINTESSLWEFTMDAVSISSNKSLNKTYPVCMNNCIALADTSSNTIMTSLEYLKILNAKIGAKPLYFGRYEVECDRINKLPFVNFAIGGTDFQLSGKDYVQKVSIGPFTICLSAFTSSNAKSANDRWILGGAFLYKYFSIYDLGNKRVGFVRAASA